MPYIEMKSKISKVLGVCKKHKPTSRSSCALSKLSEHMESMTTATTHTCNDDEKHQLVSSGLDTFARDNETNEPAEMLVEDTSQSQVFVSSVDGSESVEKMEIASNYMSNSDTIFSPVLNDELDGTDRVFTSGNSVHWEIPRWGADESSNRICFDNQTCNVSDFYISDVLIASLPFDESGNNDAFTEISPLPHYIFPEQYMLLPYLEDGSANTEDVKSDVDSKINFDNHDLFLAFNRTRSHNIEPADHAESEQAEDFDPQLFIKNQPELSDVVSSYWPRDTLRKKSVTLVLDLDETLVHSTLESCNVADFSFRVFFNMQENTVYVKQRPYLHSFLERVEELFHVVIFTASHSIYASQLLDILDPEGKFISQRFYRDSCILSDGIYTKDLTVLGLDLAKVAIIDNCPQVYRLQINNGIPIKSWYDDPSDDGLISILPFLETLAVADDVRPIIGRRFGNKE
ncbi:Mitochondrial import inner membrane translocase subunit TIM50 [Cardamine amara subsp. amara]|uniref:Mitochondrial import inner membrane translocase subunit TIM50 n=1 Tax=Cardamine amara subsp. amara TaxID=228776 RepID=A0ABD1B6R9_CARAN